MDAPKPFFKPRTVGGIKKLDRIVEEESVARAKTRTQIAATIRDMAVTQYYVIRTPGFVPPQYPWSESYMRYARTFPLLDTAASAREGLAAAVDTTRPGAGVDWSLYCGYSFTGIAPDRRSTVVPLVELCKAAHLYNYLKSHGDAVSEANLDDRKSNVAYQGANATVMVSSRRQKDRKNAIVIRSIPVVKNSAASRLWRGVKSRTDIEIAFQRDKRSAERGKESNDRYYAFAPEIAAYWLVCDYYWNREQNSLPYLGGPFVAPSFALLDYYQKLRNNTLAERIRPDHTIELDHLNDAEKEILLWAFVKRQGYHRSFSPHRGERLSAYAWDLESTAPSQQA